MRHGNADKRQLTITPKNIGFRKNSRCDKIRSDACGQVSRPDTSGCRGFIVIRRIAADADRADDLATVLQNPAGDRTRRPSDAPTKATPKWGKPITRSLMARDEPHPGKGLAGRDLRAQCRPGAIPKGHTATIIHHRDRQRVWSLRLKRSRYDYLSLVEEFRHGSPLVCVFV